MGKYYTMEKTVFTRGSYLTANWLNAFQDRIESGIDSAFAEAIEGRKGLYGYGVITGFDPTVDGLAVSFSDGCYLDRNGKFHEVDTPEGATKLTFAANSENYVFIGEAEILTIRASKEEALSDEIFIAKVITDASTATVDQSEMDSIWTQPRLIKVEYNVGDLRNGSLLVKCPFRPSIAIIQHTTLYPPAADGSFVKIELDSNWLVEDELGNFHVRINYFNFEHVKLEFAIIVW